MVRTVRVSRPYPTPPTDLPAHADLSEMGRLLRRAREAKRLGRPEVARALRVNATYPGYLERGARRPTPRLLARIATLLDADYTELARAAGYAPQSIGEYTVTVDSLEKAAWLRQLAARFGAAELEAAYSLLLQWAPRAAEVRPEYDSERRDDAASNGALRVG